MSSGRGAGSAGTAGVAPGTGTGNGMGPGDVVPAGRVASAPGTLGRGEGSAGEGRSRPQLSGPSRDPLSRVRLLRGHWRGLGVRSNVRAGRAL